jgi:hypothetical protein
LPHSFGYFVFQRVTFAGNLGKAAIFEVMLFTKIRNAVGASLRHPLTM